MKYPCGSVISGQSRDRGRVEQKKFGYFEDERELIVPALTELGMREYGSGAFRRHPLAFLVEAADDICYALVDLEDSVDQGVIEYEEAFAVLEPLANRTKPISRAGYSGQARLEWLRAYAMNALVAECGRVFEAKIEDVLAGTFSQSLIDASDVKDDYDKVRKAVKDKAYKDKRVLEVEAAGFQVIRGLLDFFVPALIGKPDDKQTTYGQMIWLLPEAYFQKPGTQYEDKKPFDREKVFEDFSAYQRILIATDYISGMTDTFAIELYQKLSGIRLPT